MEMKGPISKTTAELVELCQQLRAIDMETLKKVATPDQLTSFKQMRIDCGLIALTMSSAECFSARR